MHAEKANKYAYINTYTGAYTRAYIHCDMHITISPYFNVENSMNEHWIFVRNRFVLYWQQILKKTE